MSKEEIEALDAEMKILSEKMAELSTKKKYLRDKIDLEEAEKRRIEDYQRRIKWEAEESERRKQLELIPHFDVTYSEARNSFLIKVNQGGNSYYITSAFNAKTFEGKWEIPAFEAFRLKEVFSNHKVRFDTKTEELIERSIALRSEMDKIALQKDTEAIPADLFSRDVPTAFHLKPSQKVFIEFAKAANGRVLNADPTGMGKTAQALGYAKILKEELKRDPVVIIICPALAKISWERAIYQLMDVEVETFYGTVPEVHHMKKLLVERPKFSLFNYDLLSRAQEIPNKERKEGVEYRYLWIELINMLNPDLIIIDECHYIKNLDAGRTKAIRGLKCNRVIFLSGTPMLNRPGEMWPVLNIIDPGTFDNYDGFLKEFTYNGKEPKNVETLRSLLRPIMIRRKRDYTDAVVTRIPKYHELSEKAQKIYNKILAGIYEMIDSAGNSLEKEIPNILVQIMRMKQVCAIDKIQEVVDFAEELYNTSDPDDKYKKVLIFSQFVPIVEEIGKRLGKDAVVVSGKLEHWERDRIVQDFQNYGNKKYLVASMKSIKENHTITSSSKTIFVDLFWTPADHEQCEGRSYARINDPHGIDAYYFQTVKSIEEWCMDLLFGKDANIKSVVDGVESDRQASIAGSIVKRLVEESHNMFAGVRRK